MRLSVIAGLLILGVAGLGVVAAQKAAGPGSPDAPISGAPSDGAAPRQVAWTDTASAPPIGIKQRIAPEASVAAAARVALAA
jgi:hypothetical protein